MLFIYLGNEPKRTFIYLMNIMDQAQVIYY